MTLAPMTVDAERTTTVVIGSGLSGLAVASELSRQGIETIVVDSLELLGSVPAIRNIEAAEPASLMERSDLLRVLRRYATNRSVDIRTRSKATELRRTVESSVGTGSTQQWMIRTSDGVLMAENIVLTRCAQSQLREFFSSIGIAIGQDIAKAMRALGIYLVGIGEAIVPSTRDILRQAKTVSEAICVSCTPKQTAIAALN